MIIDLSGKRAIVTGSTAGIGFAIAKGLADSGAEVIVNGRTAKRVDDAVTELKKTAKATPSGIVADLATAKGAVDFIKQAADADILVNNLGIFEPKPFADITDDDWRVSMDVALDACFRLSRKVAAGMVQRGWGRVVMVSSVNARIGRGTNTAYITAKAGLEGLTRGLAAEVATSGVTVNCIAPGYIATDINTAFRADLARYEWIRNRTPMKRWGTPQDLAGTAVFLASEASAFMTGQVLVVDGGMTIAI